MCIQNCTCIFKFFLPGCFLNPKHLRVVAIANVLQLCAADTKPILVPILPIPKKVKFVCIFYLRFFLSWKILIYPEWAGKVTTL